MLKLKIALRDAIGPWTWADGRWRSGRSWIEPYAHPALERQSVTEGSTVRVTVRERTAGDLDPPGWSLEFTRVALTTGRIVLSTGPGGVAPLYLTAGHGTLYGSWDLADLRDHVDPTKLVEREVARLLGIRFRYGHDTVFAGITRLTERSTAVFDASGLALRYPEPALHSRARQLRDGADVVVVVYEHLLGRAISQHIYDPATSCVELSGGQDSANVAAALGNLHPGRVTACALLIVGDAALQQARRRAAFMTRLGLGADVIVGMDHLLPFAPGGRRARGVPVSPYEDPYDEAKSVLLDRLAERRVRTVFTGIGGDEMVAPTVAEWPHPPHGVDLEPKPWLGRRALACLEHADEGTAPAAMVNEMTLISQACAAPSFLRAGIWPVHPLADPELIRFGEWLPLEWRRRKRIHRTRLERLGCGGELTHPKLTENFAEVMREAIRRHGLIHIDRMLAEGSPLIDQGFVDPDGLTATRDRIAGGAFADRDTELFAVIAHDLAIRAFA
ncbi:MAG: asparagine synthase [Streptosporangiales bacterium]|nr:asparagine synthase [Streptosporangiales bacterium]